MGTDIEQFSWSGGCRGMQGLAYCPEGGLAMHEVCQGILVTFCNLLYF